MSPEVPAGLMVCSVTLQGPPCVQPGGLSGAAAGIHSWNSLCALYPAVQRLTNSKDEVRPVFHGFVKKRKEEFTSDCAQL